MAESTPGEAERTWSRVPGAAYLLSQVGAHSAQLWHARTASIGLHPREALILRTLGSAEVPNQSSLARRLGLPASRIVGLVDAMEQAGLLERRPNAHDRRSHALHLTTAGHAKLGELRRVSSEHEADLTRALTDAQRETLIDLLLAIGDAQGLVPGSHPGLAP